MPWEQAMAFFTVKDAAEVVGRVASWYAEEHSAHQVELNAIARAFGPFEELAQWYVEPDCQVQNPVQHDLSGSEDFDRMIPSSPVFRTIDAFFASTARRDAGGANHLFVLADAGMGKTSLLIELALAKMSRLWPPKHHCYLLKLGPSTLDAVATIPNPQDTHLLLDSLDEDPMALGRTRDRLVDVLDATRHFRKVVVTSRTQFFEPDREEAGRAWLGPYRCPLYYLSPFTDDQVNRYLAKRLTPTAWQRIVGRQHPDLDRAKEAAKLMGQLRARPMLLSYIDDILEGSGTGHSYDEYGLYTIVVDQWLAREACKARERGEVGLTARRLLLSVMVLATEAQETGTRELDRVRIAGLSAQMGEVSAVERMTLEGRSLLNRTGSGAYRFAHYSFQEYLAARALCFHREAFVREPHFQWTDLLKTFFVQASKRKQADSHSTKLQGTDLQRRNLVDADLRGANLQDADLEGALLVFANLQDANLQNANLRGALLDHASLARANLQGAVLHKASLGNASLEHANLTGANLGCANLAGTNLEQAQLQRADVAGANLQGANLQGANLRGAILCYANLLGANLENASLLAADLQGADLRGGNLHEGNLLVANLAGTRVTRQQLAKTMGVTAEQLAQVVEE